MKVETLRSKYRGFSLVPEFPSTSNYGKDDRDESGDRPPVNLEGTV